MRRALTSAVLAVTLTVSLLATLAGGAGAAEALTYAPCPTTPGFECSSLQVPLDRKGAVPGTVTLNISRKLAGQRQSTNAVLALAGGPGQAALPLAPFIAEAIAPALTARDLLVFDQRGTGTSGALKCPSAEASAESETRSAERCALEIGPARGSYTTAESVQDIEAIRQAGGYEKLVLYGTSYGTKVALEYAARFPQHVEALVLDSTETPEGPDPFRVSTFQAMRPALAELCSRRACARAGANPLGELAKLIRKTESRPLGAQAFQGNGRKLTGTIGPQDLYSLLLAGDLNPIVRSDLPGAVHAALHGDTAPLARMLTMLALRPPREPTESEVDTALFLATSCEETLFPWSRQAPPATRAVEAESALNALPGSDFYPFDAESALSADVIPLCVSWPDASAPPAPVGPLPNVPALILSGGQDLRTPTANARAVAALIPDAQLLTVPFTGHSVIGADFSGCAETALTQFFSGVTVAPCAASRNRFPPSSPPPRRLSALRPARGLHGGPGRTVTAAVDSLADLRRTVIALIFNFGEPPKGLRFGGLRGGSATLTGDSVRLRSLTFVPGVRLSGVVPLTMLLKHRGSAADLTIAGPAASHGRLSIAPTGAIAGRLAGRSLRTKAAALARAPVQGEPSDFPLPGLARVR